MLTDECKRNDGVRKPPLAINHSNKLSQETIMDAVISR